MRPYSNDLRGRVVAAMEGGMSCRTAAERFGVAPSTAGNWHRSYRARKSYAPLPIGGDRRSKLLGEAEWIAAHLAKTPDLRLLDVQHALAAKGVAVSYSGVQRMVKRLGLRFKKNDLRDRTGPA
jgi:putative transposase